MCELKFAWRHSTLIAPSPIASRRSIAAAIQQLPDSAVGQSAQLAADSRTYAHTHIHTCTYIHTYIHTYTYTHTHTHLHFTQLVLGLETSAEIGGGNPNHISPKIVQFMS